MTSNTGNDDPNVGKIALVGVIGAILLFVIIVAMQALFYNVEDAQRTSKLGVGDPNELGRLRAGQLEQLHTYRWIDKPNGVVGIPVDLSMDLIVREANDEKVTEPKGVVEQP